MVSVAARPYSKSSEEPASEPLTIDASSCYEGMGWISLGHGPPTTPLKPSMIKDNKRTFYIFLLGEFWNSLYFQSNRAW